MPYDYRRASTCLTLCLSVCSLLLFFAGCAGVKVNDTLPPSAPKGYAEFANFTEGYDIIYSMKGGKKVKEGSLESRGARLRVARTPGSYDFLIENGDRSGKITPKAVTVKIERDMVTFVTTDDMITDISEDIFDRRPISTVKYALHVSVAETPAPLQFQPETARDTLRSLLHDPDWNARLYAVASLGQLKSAHDEDLMKTVTSLASDDANDSVRRKAAEFLQGLGIDPYEHVLFLENFYANDKRRWISSTGQYAKFYHNDEFRLAAASGTCEQEMLTTPLDLPRSFDVELVTAWRAGVDNDAYGVLIGSDKDNYDLFGISGDGRAIVRSIRNTEAQPDLLGWTAMDGINKHGSNRIKVEVRGALWKYFVNGASVGTVENKLELPPFAFSLAVCQKQTISFDQLKITSVPEK